ncbi:hypothetical protein BHE74_00020211 [Ensete ventricosum]|nr:hypothetical protein BHE74_00020211 [Ensete ventricosum]RZR76294.1 hypothetical protein BHM03_00001000 [Ensete ventricosum]
MGNTNSAEGSSPCKCPLPSTRNYAHPSSYRYPQQPHFTAGSSFNNKDQTKQQPAFIADNFSSLEEVNYFVPLVGMPYLPHKPQGSRFQLRSSDLQRLWDSNTHMPNLPGTHYHTPEAIFLIEK